MMQDFQDSKIWQKAHALNLLIYTRTVAHIASEFYDEIMDIRQIAMLIASRLIESCSHDLGARKKQLISDAVGKSYRLECMVELCYQLDMMDRASFEAIQESVMKLKSMLKKTQEELLRGQFEKLA